MAEKEKVKLRYMSDEAEGYRRKKHGRGFIYYDPEGNKVTKEELEERLELLRIPPMWKDVWISWDPEGHLQATGYDERGRKQYIYHPQWVAYRTATKYARLTQFGEKLPKIRRRVYEDLQQEAWTREKVLALVISVLDESYIRIGNKAYLKENNTYGLTTLRRKHLELSPKEVVFRYQAKSGKEREVNIRNETIVALIKECNELPGYELFRYQEDGRWHTVDSEDVNSYLYEIAGESFSSKFFRTWGGTVVAVEMFEQALKDMEEKNARKNLVATLVQHVAEELGNTPAVCREYYIHPAILQAVEDGSLQQIIRRSRVEQKDDFDLRKCEKIALKFLKAYDKENLPEPVLREG
jgi:DNA topoisomerase-1